VPPVGGERGQLENVTGLRVGQSNYINSILRRAFFVDVSEAVSPADKDDPYAPQSEVPGDCGLQCRMVAGVASVYRDQDAVDRNEALPLPCPRLSDFLADRAVLTRLISDGPV